MELDWINLLQVIGGILIGGGSVCGWKAAKRKGMAEAEHAEHDAEKAEVDRLLSELDHQQKTVENLLTLNNNLTARLSKLNETVDKHIDRNRELSDRVYKSETEINRNNERIIKLTEERDWERIQKEHYKQWQCQRNECRDPDGRIPPNDKLKGLKYDPPKRKK